MCSKHVHTYRCDDTRGCVMQFWPSDDEHMCSKHVEAWNKLIVKQKFCASSWLITEINILRCTVSKTSKAMINFRECIPLGRWGECVYDCVFMRTPFVAHATRILSSSHNLFWHLHSYESKSDKQQKPYEIRNCQQGILYHQFVRFRLHTLFEHHRLMNDFMNAPIFSTILAGKQRRHHKEFLWIVIRLWWRISQL